MPEPFVSTDGNPPLPEALAPFLDAGGAGKAVWRCPGDKDYVFARCGTSYQYQIFLSGIRIEALGKKGRVDFGFLAKLIGLIRREKVDLIHAHLFTSNLWGRVAAWITGVPIIATEHNVDHWKKPYHFWIDRIVKSFTRFSVP